MKFMEERILRDGQVRPGNILKVDSFLNHQLDVELLNQVGQAFYDRFGDRGITRIMTVEASGIAIACITAQYFKVPVVFAKKAKSKNLDGDLYTSVAHSFTYDRDFTVTLAKKFLHDDDCVLLVDDFMANGKAMNALLDICHQAGARIGGIGITIEKGFQGGGDALREKGYHLESLAIVEKLDAENGIIEFRK